MRGTDCNQDRVFKRREIAALANLQFLLEITGEIVVSRELNGWRKWGVSLHEDFTRRFAAASASGDLREKLEGAFACSEIGQMQGEIGVDDSDECHVRKMQTLGDHLRADEDVDLASAKISQCFAIRFLARHGICIHAAHDGLRKNLRNRGFHFLGAESVIDQRVLAARRAFLSHRSSVPAQVTAQSSGDRWLPMKGE